MLLSEHEMTKESGVKLTLVVPEEYDCGIGHTCDSRTHTISGAYARLQKVSSAAEALTASVHARSSS
jgi:hypothetical protein